MDFDTKEHTTRETGLMLEVIVIITEEILPMKEYEVSLCKSCFV